MIFVFKIWSYDVLFKPLKNAVKLSRTLYCNVDDKALLGNDSIKQQWKSSNRCYAMTQYTHVNNGDEDVFCVVGAVLISRV
jgi:hypothetical protein